jgi:hypothetical protein
MDFTNKFDDVAASGEGEMKRERKAIIKLVVGVSLLMMSCVPALSGQLVSNSSSFDVTDLNDARVNIISLQSKKSKSYVVKVGGDGSFSLDANLKKGRYLVEALVPGYEMESKEIDLTKTNRISISLSKNKKGANGSRSINVNMGVDASRGGGGATITPPHM